ncbi:hypothetical protein [Bordetella petrii]|uniref:Exported protein n=1 Tax=Bordetella petrii (strain ATCC BAA-461 / DSM 12804 / CCUG 43448 / CIP 107267 / Se-1111R) TaxID=340100 RepID=A9HW18_BORPD|nr:hypothetical protein [Bordetella petrii]CAP40419.1 putative exported protein [Bordetella petrii]
MSWRVLFATLLLALGAAAWGGIQLGDWLVAHAPKATAAPGQESLVSQEPVLDANGRPYVAQPPQPRVDGTLGVPDKPSGESWTVSTVSLFDTTTDPSVHISRDNISMDEARELAAASPVPLPSGPSDVTTLDLQSLPPTTTAPPPNQQAYALNPPVTMPTAPTPPAANNGAWKQALQQELARCADKGFFERPTCSWNARNKYCGPNRAWGTIAECPRRPE